jgi:hypothetical protein
MQVPFCTLQRTRVQQGKWRQSGQWKFWQMQCAWCSPRKVENSTIEILKNHLKTTWMLARRLQRYRAVFKKILSSVEVNVNHCSAHYGHHVNGTTNMQTYAMKFDRLMNVTFFLT